MICYSLAQFPKVGSALEWNDLNCESSVGQITGANVPVYAVCERSDVD